MNNFCPNGVPFWHICTSGKSQAVLFPKEEYYKFAINALAFSLATINSFHMNVRLYAFCIMSNHIHLIIEGEYDNCVLFFSDYKMRLKRAKILDDNGNSSKLFTPTVVPIESAEQLRIEIGYVHRNPLKAFGILPTFYKWSTGTVYYNPLKYNFSKVTYNSLSQRAKMNLSHTKKEIDTPETYTISDGLIDICSFCEIDKGEKYFNNANYYITFLSRSIEIDSVISKSTNGQKSDNELLALLPGLCKKHFPFSKSNMKELTPDQKTKLAKELHFNYHSGNHQISRILAIPLEQVCLWFPQKEK